MELAINQYGEAFTPPADAAAWLVRRMNDTKHGGPLPTFGADGRPLTLPVAATMADFQATLRKLGAASGKYRLDPLDRNGQPIKGGCCSYLLYPPGDEARNGNTAGGGLRNAPPPVQGWAPAPTAAPWSSSPAPAMWSTGGAFPLPTPGHLTGAEYLLGESVRAQAAMMQTMAQVQAQSQAQIGALITAAAELVRAADGASLTKRKPGVAMVAPAPQVIVQPVAQPIYEAPPTDDRDDHDDREVAAPAPAPASAMPSWLSGAVDMLAPMIAPIVQAKIGELLGGGFAAVGPELPVMPRNAAPVIDVEPAPEVEQAPEIEPVPAVDIMPAAWSHLGAVARYLGADGKRRLDAELRTLSREEQSGLARDLVAMPLAAAAERVIAWVSVRELRAARARAAAAPASESTTATATAPAAGSVPMPTNGPAVLDSMRASVAAAMAAAGEVPATTDGDASTGEAGAHDSASAPTASDTATTDTTAPGADGATAAPGAAVVELYKTLAAEDTAVGSFLRAHPAGVMLVQAATQFIEPDVLNELDRAISGAEMPAAFASAVGLPFAAPTAPTAPTAAPTTASAPAATPTPTADPVKVPLGVAMARMNEVFPHLSPEERALAQSLALKMPTAQRDSMLATLVAVSVPEAVTLVRGVVAEYVKHGRPFDR